MNRLIVLYQPMDWVRSFDFFKKSDLSAERHNYDKQVYISVNNLMAYDNGRANYKHAIIILKKALKFGKENNLPKAMEFVISTIGLEYLRLNNFDSAFIYQKKGLKQFSDMKYEYGMSVVYEKLGVIFMIKNEFITALKYFYISLNLNQKLKLKHETGVSLYHIGFTKLYLADYKEAVNYILASLKIWDELNEVANQWNSNELIGNIYIYIKLGDYKRRWNITALHWVLDRKPLATEGMVEMIAFHPTKSWDLPIPIIILQKFIST